MKLSKYLILAAILFAAHTARAECVECHISEQGLQLIRMYEGFSPVIYSDVGGKPTIGYGHLIMPGEKFPIPLIGPPAEELLAADIRPKERDVNRLAAIPLRQPQFDALTSFTFNVGSGNLASSTLLKKVNIRAFSEAAVQFEKWVYVNGKIVSGLARRRKSEAKLFLQP